MRSRQGCIVSGDMGLRREINSLINESGMSWRSIAKQTGLNLTNLSRWLRGRKTLGFDKVDLLRDFLLRKTRKKYRRRVHE